LNSRALPTAALVVLKHSLDPEVVGLDALVEQAQALGNLEQSLAKHFTQAVTLGLSKSLDQQPPRPCSRTSKRCTGSASSCSRVVPH